VVRLLGWKRAARHGDEHRTHDLAEDCGNVRALGILAESPRDDLVRTATLAWNEPFLTAFIHSSASMRFFDGGSGQYFFGQ
jgi:hypothetical protein